MTVQEHNHVIPLAQYALFMTFQILDRKQFNLTPNWDLWLTNLVGFRKLGDFLIVSETHPLDMLSHGQDLALHSGDTLCGVLFNFLDWQSVSASNSLTVLAVPICASFLIRESHFKTFLMSLLKDSFKSSIVWTSLFCNQGEAFYDTCLNPLKRVINWRVTRLS